MLFVFWFGMLYGQGGVQMTREQLEKFVQLTADMEMEEYMRTLEEALSLLALRHSDSSQDKIHVTIRE